MSRYAWLLGFCVVFNGCACHAHLLGLVEDGSNGEPLVGVEVRAVGVDEVFRTDRDGWFELEAPCREQAYTVQVQAPGYEDYAEDFVLEEHEIECTLTLSPKAD